MRRLLRSGDTRLFFKQSGDWTPDPADALCFPTRDAAIDECRARALKSMEIYYSFSTDAGPSTYDFSLPISDLPRLNHPARP